MKDPCKTSKHAHKHTPLPLITPLTRFLKSYFQTIPKILPQSPSSYCPDSAPCIRPDLLAFQATCAVPILITALYGTKSYLALKRKEDTTLEERGEGEGCNNTSMTRQQGHTTLAKETKSKP